MEYDYIIIGGGISGLNTASNLSQKYNNKSILLIEAKNHFGGRIYTVYNNKYNFKYESGAARYNNNHVNLIKLIKKYNLTPIEISSNKNIDYLHICTNNYSIHKHNNSYKFVDNCLKFLINKSKKIKKEELQKYTLSQFSKKHLGLKTTQQLINIFGYCSEFDTLNCYDSLNSFKDNFNYNKKFFIIKEGMSELINHMVIDLKKNNIELKNKTKLLNISYENNKYILKTNNISYITSNIIFCIKPTQLLELSLFNPIKKNLNNIIPRPLLRIYAAYKKNNDNEIWFHNLSRFTTNHPIRHFIPININKGLAMISYTDGDDCLFLLGKYYDKTLKKYLHDEFKKIFPEKHINQPYYFSVEFWDEGAHYWKKNIDSDNLSQSLLYPMKEKYPNLYICGEAISQQQAWVEGAIISSNNLFKKYL